MIKKIKTYIFTALMALTFAAPALVPAVTAYAACNNIGNKVSEGANQAAQGGGGSTCDQGSGVNDAGLGALASKLVNTFSLIVGVVAVIMIIYGGFRYITSGGDSNRVGAAKNSLIYAIVGLIIVALAQLIVHFILQKTGEVQA